MLGPKSRVLAVGEQAPTLHERPVFGLPVRIPDPGGRRVALIFGRHLGSPLCRQLMEDMQRRVERCELQDTLLALVTRSGLELARDAVPRRHALFPVLVDADRRLHQAWGVGKDRLLLRSLLRAPQGLPALAQAALRHGQGLPDGCLVQRSAAFLVSDEGTLLSVWYGRGLADLPDLDALLGFAST